MLKEWYEKISSYEYTQKLSASVTYGILSAVALNVFWQPGNIYAGGITGMSQIIKTMWDYILPFDVPLSIIIYAINVPLFFLAWKRIGHKFTIFTIASVTISTIFIQIIPETVLIDDPLMCAIFGGAISGLGGGFALKNGISSGGMDVVTIYLRRKTGRSIGSISITINSVIILVAGILFGWPYAFYSIMSIFASGKVTDSIYTKQQKMQVLIVTKQSDEVINEIQEQLRRGITIIHGAEGAYYRDEQKVLITVITRYEMPLLKKAMKKTDPGAFVSISDNVRILGNFYEPEMEE